MVLGFRFFFSPSWWLARTGLMAALLVWGSTLAIAQTRDASLPQQGPAPDASAWSGEGDALSAFATDTADFYRVRSYRTVWLDRGVLNAQSLFEVAGE